MKQTVTTSAALIFALTTALGASACDKSEEKKDLAPTAASLEADKAPETNLTYEVIAGESNVDFLMDAELEKIFGRAPDSTSGSISLDPSDLSKTKGLIKIDLLKLSIFQKKRKSGDEEFGEETKNERQNGDMRTWLQISEDGPKAQREANRYAEFKITKVEAQEQVSELKGNKREVDLQVSGTLRLHGRTTEHTFKATAAFSFEGDRALGVVVTSKEPVKVDLEKHDVKPRSAFSVLADKTLEAMGSKVSKIAEVSLDIAAQAK